ncbi:MAG: MFS transporter, partial [Bryobacteraceae bacterium]
LLLSAFSLAYALSAPFMGWFIDRVGLNRGISISVALWSLTSIATGFARGFNQILACRTVLGVVEASGISALGKLNGLYLLPKERAVGAAMGQLGLSIGAGVAPAMATYFAYRHNWRWSFYAAGILGLIWIPAWLFTSKTIPPAVEEPRPMLEKQHPLALLKDSRLWALMGANCLGMTFYSLWTNWTPTYLVQMHHLTPKIAAHYSWIVPVAGYAGAFLGGSLSWKLISHGWGAAEARKRVCLVSACIVLLSAAIPLLTSPAWATVGMSLSFFWISAWSTNLYTLPVDIYGAGRAATGVSALVFAYGAMQTVVSRPIGVIIEHHGFRPVLWTFALLPLLASLLLQRFVREEPDAA